MDSRLLISCSADALLGSGSFLCGLRCLRRGLPALGGLRTEPLGETFDAALGIDQLLAAREERMAVVADLEVQFRLRRPGLPGGAAGAPGLDLVVLGVDPFLHSLLLAYSGKRVVYHRGARS